MLHVLNDLGVIDLERVLHVGDGLRLLQHVLLDLGLVAHALQDGLVAVTVGIFERCIHLESGNCDGRVEHDLVALLLLQRLADVLIDDLGLLDGFLEFSGKRQGTELEELDIVPRLGRNLLLEIFLHLGLDLLSFLEEAAGLEARGSVRDDIDDDSREDLLLIFTIVRVDVVDVFGLNDVLEGGLDVELKAVLGAALDHGQVGLGEARELNRVHLDVVLDELVA